MDSNKDIKMLLIVVNAGFADEAMKIARGEGAKGATILNARGEGIVHKSFMGITVDSEREMLLILIDGKTAEKIMNAIAEKLGIQSPAQGICFCMPVERTTVINNFPMAEETAR